MLANEQGLAERCYVTQLNLYLDSVGALGSRYGECKRRCLQLDPELAKELERREKKEGAEYFSPMYTSACLGDCRNTFYFTYKRLSKYFGGDQERGFFIEGTFQQQMM